MLRKSGGSVSCASSAMVPASSTPVGPAPMMTKVSSAARRCGIAFALGVLEGDQDAAPQRGGVLQRLQAGRERLPFVMAEIGVAGAGGEHQRVVGQRVAAIERHAARLGIDAGHRGEQGRDLGTPAQQIADRPGDLRGRKCRGRDLIQQRLEQMMVAPVDQRDRDRRAGKPIHRLQPAKTGADDHDAMGCRRHLPSMVVSSVSLLSTTKIASSFAGSVVLAFSLIR